MTDKTPRVWTLEKGIPSKDSVRYTSPAKDKNFIFAAYLLYNGQFRLYYEHISYDLKNEFCIAEYLRCLSFANGLADIVDRGVWCQETKTFTPAQQDAIL